MLLRVETTADHAAIRQVNQLAFGQEAEALLVDALREEGFVRQSIVAEAEGQLVGHILFSELPLHTAEGVMSTLALAPMAVRPDFQRQGIGSALVQEGLTRCREEGGRIVVVLGHVEYYPRFGFSAALAEALHCPFYAGPALMAMALVPQALDGVSGELRYPPPFQNV